MKNLQTFEEFLNESSLNEKRERRISFKGNKTNQLYNIVKGAENSMIFANGKHYSVDVEEMRHDLQNPTVIATDEDGEEFEIKVSDIEFIEIYESHYAFLRGNENLNESYNDKDAYKAAVDILKTLHGFSDKIRFSIEEVNRYYNIVYDDPKGLTSDCLKRLSDNKFWNTEYAPTTGKFPNGRVNITFQKSSQEILDIENFDKKNWSPKK